MTLTFYNSRNSKKIYCCTFLNKSSVYLYHSFDRSVVACHCQLIYIRPYLETLRFVERQRSCAEFFATQIAQDESLPSGRSHRGRNPFFRLVSFGPASIVVFARRLCDGIDFGRPGDVLSWVAVV